MCTSLMYGVFSLIIYFFSQNQVPQLARDMKLIQALIGVITFLSSYSILKARKFGFYGLVVGLLLFLYNMIKVHMPIFIVIPACSIILLGLLLLHKFTWDQLEK